MELLPRIEDQGDAQRLVRRAWGGWLLLGCAVVMLFVVISAGLKPKFLAPTTIAVIALAGLAYALYFRKQAWAALVLAALIVAAIIRVIYMIFDKGFADYSPLAAALPPILLSFALLSLVNGYRGALALGRELPARETQLEAEQPAKQRSFKKAFLVGLGFVAIWGLNTWYLNERDAERQLGARDPSAKTPDEASVQAMVTRESAEGGTEDQMDQEFLSKLEQLQLERIRTKTERVRQSQGLPFDPTAMTAEGVFVEAGGRRLAITRFKILDVTFGAEIVGIIGDEAIRVFCFTDEPADLIITRGPCNDKVQEAFGVSLDPRGNG